MSKPIHIIAALDDHNGIGKQGTIPWNLPADIQRFKQLTTTVSSPENINAVIMGRKTWESIPERFRPLSNRLNIVLTHGGSVISGARHVGNFLAAIALANDDPQVENIWVIGGGTVYTEALPLAKELYITSLHCDYECDTFFPAIPEEFALHDFSDVQKHEDLSYYFLRYGRVQSDDPPA